MMFGLWLSIIRKEIKNYESNIAISKGNCKLECEVVFSGSGRDSSVRHHSAPPVGTTFPFSSPICCPSCVFQCHFCSPPFCPSSGYHIPFLFSYMLPLLRVPVSFLFTIMVPLHFLYRQTFHLNSNLPSSGWRANTAWYPSETLFSFSPELI